MKFEGNRLYFERVIVIFVLNVYVRELNAIQLNDELEDGKN